MIDESTSGGDGWALTGNNFCVSTWIFMVSVAREVNFLQGCQPENAKPQQIAMLIASPPASPAITPLVVDGVITDSREA